MIPKEDSLPRKWTRKETTLFMNGAKIFQTPRAFLNSFLSGQLDEKLVRLASWFVYTVTEF